MSLTGPDYFQAEAGTVMLTAAGRPCFLCERPIRRDPAWMWQGATGAIFLHVGCTADFITRIASDVHHWQKRTGRRFHELDSPGRRS